MQPLCSSEVRDEGQTDAHGRNLVLQSSDLRDPWGSLGFAKVAIGVSDVTFCGGGGFDGIVEYTAARKGQNH